MAVTTYYIVTPEVTIQAEVTYFGLTAATFTLTIEMAISVNARGLAFTIS